MCVWKTHQIKTKQKSYIPVRPWQVFVKSAVGCASDASVVW